MLGSHKGAFRRITEQVETSIGRGMTKQQWEEDAKDRFIVALSALQRGNWSVSDRDVVVDAATGRNFDYELQCETAQQSIALEIFRLVDDEEEIARQKLWAKVANSIAAELRKRGITGYSIITPRFTVQKNRIPEFVKNTADAIEAGIMQNADKEKFRISEFQLSQIPDFPDISLSSFGPGGAVDPPGIALTALEEKLRIKNEQLAIDDHERVLLVVNWTRIVDLRDMVSACSQVDFSQFANVDQIYFEEEPGKISLVYDRRVFLALSEGEQPLAEVETLFVEWLGNRLAHLEAAAFEQVKKLTTQRGSLHWLPDSSREQLISYGEEFLQKGEWENVRWIVENLKDDPNPVINRPPEENESTFSEHCGIERGESGWFIHSVRGRLCWLLQKIVAVPKTEYYESVLGIIEEYATGANLYIRQQAIVPLIELTKRRFAKIGGTGERFMTDSLAKRTKDLAVRLLDENEKYPVLLEWTSHVLVFIRDLDEETAWSVLNRLLPIASSDASDDIAYMAIYFGLFREREFGKLGPFQSERFKEFLSENLRYGVGRFRGTAAMHLKAILEQGQAQFQELMPYLESLARGASESVVTIQFYRITALAAPKHPKQACSLLQTLVEREIEKLATEGGEIWHGKEFAETLDGIAKAGPEHAAYLERIKNLMAPHLQLIFDIDA